MTGGQIGYPKAAARDWLKGIESATSSSLGGNRSTSVSDGPRLASRERTFGACATIWGNEARGRETNMNISIRSFTSRFNNFLWGLGLLSLLGFSYSSMAGMTWSARAI